MQNQKVYDASYILLYTLIYFKERQIISQVTFVIKLSKEESIE